ADRGWSKRVERLRREVRIGGRLMRVGVGRPRRSSPAGIVRSLSEAPVHLLGAPAERGERMASLVDRMIRAARLGANLYEEVEADASTMGQAMTVVVLSSVAGGIGSGSQHGVMALIGAAIASLLGWYIWAFLTFYIGTRLLPEPTTQADTGQM